MKTEAMNRQAFMARIFVVSAAVAAACLGGAANAMAASGDYPTRPIRFVVPFPPCGGADTLARVLGQKLGEAWGEQVVIDNRPGAGGNISAEIAAKAAPDGYTIFQGNVAHAISASLYARLNYDLVRDFSPVTQLASTPFVLLVNPSLPANSVRELVALAKAKPGQLNYGSSGSGGASHLAMELFKSMAGVDVRHIPYKGAGPAATDLISGQIQLMFFVQAAARPHISSGRLRGLAVASAKRSSALPELPTVAESGVPGYEAGSWYGVLVPTGTPGRVITRLHAAITRVLSLPDVKERLSNQGFEVVGNTPAQFGAYIRAEIPKWARVVKASGARVD